MAAVLVLGVVSIGTFSITSTRAAAGITTWPWAVDPSCYVGGEYVCNIPDGKPSNVGIPDLREAVPQQIGLQNTNHHSYLRISTAIGNTGDGQWQMRAVIPATTTDPQGANQQLLNPDGTIWKEYLVSEFVYHPEHKHFHIADVSAYDLYSADGPADRNPSDNANTGIGARKVTFCLIDWVKIGDNSPDNQRAYSSCEGDFQGVSPGWMDQYHQSLEGQELDVTALPTGYYFIVLTANPEHTFIEKDFSNNQAWTLIHYINDGKGNPKFEIVANSTCEPGLEGLCSYKPNR